MANAPRHLPRILLIDDDAISREVLSMMLEMHGFPVDSAEDGSHALDFLKEAAEPDVTLPSVILMDTQMPGVSGVELVAALRRTLRTREVRPAADIRIVAISGSEVSEEIRVATDGFLLKPIEVESLAALLEDSNAEKNASTSALQEILSLAAADLRAICATKPSEIEEIVDPAVLAKLKAMMPPAALKEVYTAVASDLETRLVTLEAAMDAGERSRRSGAQRTPSRAAVGWSASSAAREPATQFETSNRPETGRNELLQLHFALNKLKEILSNGLL